MDKELDFGTVINKMKAANKYQLRNIILVSIDWWENLILFIDTAETILNDMSSYIETLERERNE